MAANFLVVRWISSTGSYYIGSRKLKFRQPRTRIFSGNAQSFDGQGVTIENFSRGSQHLRATAEARLVIIWTSRKSTKAAAVRLPQANNDLSQRQPPRICRRPW